MSMRSAIRGSGVEGFTVLELAIALAIAGIALVSLLELFSTTVVTAGRADRLTEATLLARSKLAETESVEPVSMGSSSGTTPEGLTWHLETRGYPGEGQSGTRRLVSIAVAVGEDRRSDMTESKPLVRLDTIAFVAVR